MDNNQGIEQQKVNKTESGSEQMTSSEYLHSELNTDKLTKPAEGDVGQTYHQYQHEQERYKKGTWYIA